MRWHEVEKLESNSPALLLDGRFGIIIKYDSKNKAVGVQVPGEDDIRWILAGCFGQKNGALIQFCDNEICDCEFEIGQDRYNQPCEVLVKKCHFCNQREKKERESFRKIFEYRTIDGNGVVHKIGLGPL